MDGARVAVTCCRRNVDSDASDLYPDGDAAPLQAALAARHAPSSLVSWDDPGADWATFSHVVVSSTWDSVDRPEEYLAWARSTAQQTRLINPVEVIEWNLDKVHQREFAAAGLPVIPTTWVAPGDQWEPEATSDFVVKPSISAGGRSTARYTAGDPAAIRHVQGLQQSGQTVMVQEYLCGIDVQGEVDLIYVAGRFSHAVLKQPALRIGQGVLERAWEHMTWAGVTTPSSDQFAVADATQAFLSQRFAHPLVYARVDLIDDPTRGPLILEVELIDPNLSLDMQPTAADGLAAAILNVAR